MTQFDIIDELTGRARKAAGYYTYRKGNDNLVMEALRVRRELDGDGYSRPAAYRWLVGLENLAWENTHPGALAKLFYMPLASGGDQILAAYAWCEEGGSGEELATREDLAMRLGVDVSMILVRTIPCDDPRVRDKI